MRIARWLLVVLVVLAGCMANSAEEEYRDAVPTAEALSMTVPQADSMSDTGALREALIGQRAPFYVMTRSVSAQVNGGVWFAMQIVHTIVRQRPTTIDNEHAVWGPWTDSLSPITYRFEVVRFGNRFYRFALHGKPKASDDHAFVPVLAGLASDDAEIGTRIGDFEVNFDEALAPYDIETAPVRARGRVGIIAMDFDAAHGLDATEHPLQGKLIVGFQVFGHVRRVGAVFKNVHEPNQEPATGAYRFIEARWGGAMSLAYHADLEDEGDAKEDLALVSRWNAGGAGRGDAIVANGDLGENTLQMTECWDKNFGRTYYADNLDWMPTEGEASSCIFPAR